MGDVRGAKVEGRKVKIEDRGSKIEDRVLRSFAIFYPLSSIRYLLVALLIIPLIGAIPAASAQTVDSTVVRYDSSAIAVRSVQADALDGYLNDPDFAYDREVHEVVTWWDRFKAWLKDKIFGPLEGVNTGPVVEWVLYAVAAFGLFFAITRLLQMDMGQVFSRKRAASIAFEDLVEDIEGMDFDTLIAEATATRAYRRAVRLLYLKTLKALTTENLIDWQRDKTNHEYIDELRRPDLRSAFAELTHLFEYIWYGDFPVDEHGYERVRQRFARFGQTMQEGDA